MASSGNTGAHQRDQNRSCGLTETVTIIGAYLQALQVGQKTQKPGGIQHAVPLKIRHINRPECAAQQVVLRPYLIQPQWFKAAMASEFPHPEVAVRKHIQTSRTV